MIDEMIAGTLGKIPGLIEFMSTNWKITLIGFAVIITLTMLFALYCYMKKDEISFWGLFVVPMFFLLISLLTFLLIIAIISGSLKIPWIS